MKYEGFKEVKCICYPNNYIVIKKKSKILNFIIFNLILCLVVAFGIAFAKYVGGQAEEVLNAISDTLSKGTPI